ncbi:MAG: N-6 DNA methylase [Ignavibacteriaceae bacterium]|nr:N-6 DNA methylase [Ignavibacteriaceae bacterium]MCW8817013.1 N-6 DNA methylase [Ignavibacteriaceae bacterium]MCW8824744.1 N-6 DNA methylase [Ignavibacteriaceae bacterium]MCW9097236.1 N-6 DNA methylase [Ignavibacteriaceae bacterium]
MSAAFRNSSGGSLIERFEEITKLLYTKLYDEKNNDTKSSIFSIESKRSYENLNQLYKDSVSVFKNLLLNGRGELGDDQKAIVEIAKILSDVELSKVSSDIKGIAYEELVKNTFEKTENQQFFTPRTVVEFMIELVAPENRTNTICDPACGSGGFLIEALKYGINASGLYGMEVDKRMAWVAQMNLHIHGGNDSKIIYLDGDGSLGFDQKLKNIIPDNGFDYIITNPPFGSDFSNPNSLDKYLLGKGRSNRRRGILFIERCISWLKKGIGQLAIIIDDSILNGSGNEDVREFILNTCDLEAVISLPEATFKPYASVETSILLLKKKTEKSKINNRNVFFAQAEKVGRKPNGDSLFKRGANGKLELDNDLVNILEDFRRFRTESVNKLVDNELSFVCNAEQFKKNISTSNRIDYLFHHPSRDEAEKLLQNSLFPIKKLKDLVIRRNDSLVPNLIDPLNTWRYVGLANIEARTGEYDVTEVFGNQIKSSVGLFKKGDIVFSKLRPELRKVFVSIDEEDAYVSSECFVFRNISQDILNFDYLAFILRSDIVYGQIVYQISGTGRPRIGYNTILNLRIPLPPIDIQNTIVEDQKIARKTFLKHIENSNTELAKANNAIEIAKVQVMNTICHLHS